MKLVQFGAGNIGRSFVGPLFSRVGWDVAFVDVNPTIVDLLNRERFYTVVIKREGQKDELRRVGPVRAVDGRDSSTVAREIASADLVATSVGKAALPKILPPIAQGLALRRTENPDRPLDIIIAENARGADVLFRDTLTSILGADYPLDRLVGLIETSIGKMVPIMRQADLQQDPLRIFAEEYETLILDKRGFRGPLPDIPGLQPVDQIQAYVDRKLFIHNLGHAVAAYEGYRIDGRVELLAQAILLPGVEATVRRAMNQGADALALEYPTAYSRQDLADHIDDLVGRFKNRALGDTVHRVGRDLFRKLDREDRLVGAMLLCAGHKLPFDAIALAFRSALGFKAPDETGHLFPPDERFFAEYQNRGLSWVLETVARLRRDNPIDERVLGVLES